MKNRGKIGGKPSETKRTASQILEAKLKAQGVEQFHQLDEKLREQSTQQSEQLQQLAATLDLHEDAAERQRTGQNVGSHAAGTGKQD